MITRSKKARQDRPSSGGNRSENRHSLGLAVFLAIASASGGASALMQQQEAARDDRADNAASTQRDRSNELAEVVVTASRREGALLRVPISIQAFTQEAAEARLIRNIDDIARFTPGLEIRQGLASSTNISIRGVRSGIGAATTGIYLDETPIMVRSTGFASGNVYPQVFDLERIEVLRGPQGTLYGAGSQGGNVRFITPKPDLEQASGYVRGSQWFTDGGDPGHEIGAAVGLPLIDGKLGVRASAYTSHRGGWITRVHPLTGDVEAQNQNTEDVSAFRLALGYAATDNLRITPSIFYQKKQSGDGGRFWVNVLDSTLGPATRFWKNRSEKGNYLSGDRINQPSTDEFYLPAMQVEFQGDGYVFSSNTSYFTREYELTNDYSNLVPNLLPTCRASATVTCLPGGNRLGLPANTRRSVGPVELIPGYYAKVQWFGDQSVLAQELRLQSDRPESRLTWTIGAYYMKSDLENRQFISDPYLQPFVEIYGYPTIVGALGMPPVNCNDPIRAGIPITCDTIVSYATNDYSKDTQVAAFAEVDYQITDNLRATVGLRRSDLDFEFANLQTGPWNALTTSAGGQFNEKPITPKFGLNYTPSETTMFYATAAKGFRPGGANRAISSVRCRTQLDALGLQDAPAGFDSDEVWSYELGMKLAGVLDGRLNVAASAFRIDWEGIQQSVGLTGCGFSFVSNLGSATNQGIDLEVTYALTDNVVINFVGGYIDAKYNETIRGLGTTPIRLADDKLPVERFKGTFGFRYDLPGRIRETGRPFAQANYSYASDYQNTPAFGSAGYDALLFTNPAVSRADLQFGVDFDSLKVAVTVENALNSDDSLNLGRATGGSPILRDIIARPRTIGLTASYRF